MEILSQWRQPVSPETKRWYRSSHSKKNGMDTLLPKGLDFFVDVMADRKQFIEKNINREILVQQLIEFHQKRNAPSKSIEHITQLKSADTFIVTTGQQPGLMGGPLLTIYKMIQTIHVARQLTHEHPYHFVPAFWNAAEDHDLSEINALHWFSKENKVETFHWDIEDQSQPYFKVDAGTLPIQEIRDFIETHSHPTEFLEPLLHSIESTAASVSSYPDMFDQFLWRWFGDEGLIILRPDEAYTRQAALPYIKEEILNPEKAAHEVNEMGSKLESYGMTAQIHKRDDRTAFFLIQDKKRVPLYINDNGFADDKGKPYTRDELVSLAERNPEAFSPSAILRPVIQDAVYPTAAAVLGPNEMAYHGLLHSLYERHHVPRPCIVPRTGYTLLEPRMMKWMDQYGLDIEQLHEHPSAIAKHIVKQTQANEDELPTESLHRELDVFFSAAAKRAQAVDPSILKSLEKNKAKIEKEIENSENVLIRRESAKQETLLKHVQALQSFVYPNGDPQERCLNLFYFIVKYGDGFVNDLLEISQSTEHGSHLFVKVP